MVGRPGAGDLAQDRELADVIGVVVGHDPHLAQDGVPPVVRKRRLEVGRGVEDDLAQGPAVGERGRDGRRELLSGWPVPMVRANSRTATVARRAPASGCIRGCPTA